ncbi:MAG: hypothetical protein R3Y60_06145, partial [bacterium]
VITISEETQFSTDERKEVLNDEVEEYLITTLSVSMFGVNKDTICIVNEENEFEYVSINTLFKFTYYSIEDGKLIDVIDIIEDGEYTVVVSLKDEYYSYNHESVETNFTINYVEFPSETTSFNTTVLGIVLFILVVSVGGALTFVIIKKKNN